MTCKVSEKGFKDYKIEAWPASPTGYEQCRIAASQRDIQPRVRVSCDRQKWNRPIKAEGFVNDTPSRCAEFHFSGATTTSWKETQTMDKNPVDFNAANIIHRQ